MNVPAIADYISPIVGYRMWRWDSAGLKSVNREPWHPGQALTARCPITDHEAPARGCSCGVYAAKNYQHLLKIVDDVYDVHGEVYLWGKVVEHKLGYRAQFAYPKSFVLPSVIDASLAPSGLDPLMAYGVDISVVTHISKEAKRGLTVFEQSKKLLWTKDSGYTPTGCNWLGGFPLVQQSERRSIVANNCGHLAIDGHGRCESCFEFLPNPPEGFDKSLVERPAGLDPSDPKVLRARWAARFGEPEECQKAIEALFP